jgi:hypothetical protein
MGVVTVLTCFSSALRESFTLIFFTKVNRVWVGAWPPRLVTLVNGSGWVGPGGRGDVGNQVPNLLHQVPDTSHCYTLSVT